MHYTEAKLVQLLEQKGIGRPSTYSSLIDKIQERGYVKKENIKGKKIKCTDFELENDEITEIEKEREFGNENNKLVIQEIGILVLEYLLKTFDTFFEYEYTKQMEDELDQISKGDKEYQDLCRKCVDAIDASIPKKSDSQENSLIKSNVEIQIDDNHSYVIAKYGPAIKCKDGEKISFKSVKKHIDLDKLKNGEYKLEEIIELDNKLLGKYKSDNLYVKKGKYGIYAEWGSNKKSLNEMKKDIEVLELDEVIEFIENNEGTGGKNCVRVIDKSLSIRNGKYGDYIFYKTEKMSKPQFYKLGGFKEDYKTCSITLLKKWINDTYFNK
jgi:DNA topoisomerase-1